MDLTAITLPVALAMIGGMFALSQTIIKLYRKPDKEWEKKDIELDRRLGAVEEAVKDFKSSTVQGAEIDKRLTAVEANQNNLYNMLGDMRAGQNKLDEKIERLTDLMLKYLSDN